MDTSTFFQYDSEAAGPVDAVFLDNCSEEDWSRLIGAGRRERFRTGDVVAAEGTQDRALYIVLEGRLQTVLGAGRRRRLLAAIPTGSVFGELSFIDGAARSASVVAETDGEVLRLEFEEFETLSRTSPALAYRLLLDLSRVLVMRVRRLTDTLAGGN